MKIKLLVYLILGITFLVNTSSAQNLLFVDNLDFEKGIKGEVPRNWTFPRSLQRLGYKAYTTDSIKYSGNYSVVMINPHFSDFKPTKEDENYCTIYQSVDAYYYRNKKVRFSIYAFLEPNTLETKGEVWLLGRRDKDSIILNLINTDNPITSKEWKRYEIEAVINENIVDLRFGVILKGGGNIYLDNANLEIVQPEENNIRNSINLNPNTIDILNNIAKIYSGLRYFTPADEFQNIDWDRFLISFIKGNIDNLSNKSLYNFIEPFGRLYQITKYDSTQYRYKIKEKNFPKISYSMFYKGGPNIVKNTELTGSRRNIYASYRKREGSIYTIVDLKGMDEKEIKISCDMKVDGLTPGANSQIWTKVNLLDSEEFKLFTTVDNPVDSNNWQKRTLQFKLPKKVKDMRIAMVFIGDGRAWFDNLKVEVIEKGKTNNNLNISNSNFELPSSLNNIQNWIIEQPILNAGYLFDQVKDEKTEGERSLCIFTNPKTYVSLPLDGELYSIKLNDTTFFTFPVCVYTDSVNTLPKNKIDYSKLYQNAYPDVFYDYNDADTRIAILIQLYALINNFAINEIDKNALDKQFKDILPLVTKSNDFNEFLLLLNKFTKIAEDSRIFIWNNFKIFDYSLPILYKLVNNKLIISSIFADNTGLNIGDEILEIDNKNLLELQKNIANNFFALNTDYAFLKAGPIIRAGDKDTEVKIKIKRDGNEQLISLKRNTLLDFISEPKPPMIGTADTNTVYVDMTLMADNQFKEYLKLIEDYDNFIFDLRGEAKMSEHVVSLFTDKELKSVNWEIPIYTYPEKFKKSREIIKGELNAKSRFKNKQLVFLINERTIGYSEIIARIVKENGLGTLIGRPSNGNPSETITTRLAGGFNISVSAINCFDNYDMSLINKPIIPDILVEDNLEYILMGRDTIIENALRFLNK